MRVTVLLLTLVCAFTWAADQLVVASPAVENRQSPIANRQSLDAVTIPQLLSYQGKLTDTLGVPVMDTTYSVAFRLYTVPSGGASFWDETQTVRTRVGLFATLLGSVAQIESVPSSGSLYLGMAVAGGAELSPRLRLVGSAYSYLAGKSANADLLQGKDTTALDSRFVNEGQASSVTSNMMVDGTIAAADLGQMGAGTGQVMKWTGSAWAPRNDSTGGTGTVTSVSQTTGVVCTPNPITATGTVGFDQTYGDGRYVNEAQANGVTATMIRDTNVTMAKIARAGAATGEVIKWSGSAWAPGPDNTGGGSGVTNVYQDTGITCVPNPITSSGNVKLNLSYSDTRYVNEGQSAGGGLTGTYPNPTIAANAVGSAEVTDNSLRGADIAKPCTLTASLPATPVLVVSNTGGGDALMATGTARFTGQIVSTVTDGGFSSGGSPSDANETGNSDQSGSPNTGQDLAPLVVNSTTLCANLNSDLLDGYSAASSGASIIPYTDGTGKLDISVVPGVSYADSARIAANSYKLQGKDTTGFVRTGQANSITSAMITDATVAAADLNQMGAGTGQVMKWTGSAWAPRNDSVGGGGGNGTVRKVVQATGIVCAPNPITDSGTVRFDSTWGDARFVNEAQANSVTGAMITDGQVSSADIRDTTVNAADLKDGAVTSAKIFLPYSGSVATSSNAFSVTNTQTSSDASAIIGTHDVTDNYGVGVKAVGGYQGLSAEVTPTGSSQYYGVYSTVAGGSGTNYGLCGIAQGTNTNYGVYGNASGGSENYAGYFDGNVVVNGTGQAAQFHGVSASSGAHAIKGEGGTYASGVYGSSATASYAGVQGDGGTTTTGVSALANNATHFGLQASNSNASGTAITGAGNGASAVYPSEGCGGAFTGTMFGGYGTATSTSGYTYGFCGITYNATGFGSYGFNGNSSGTGLLGIGNSTSANYPTAGCGGAFSGTSYGGYGKGTNTTGTGMVGVGNNASSFTTYPLGSGGAFTGTTCGGIGTGTNTTGTVYGLAGQVGSSDGLGSYGGNSNSNGTGVMGAGNNASPVLPTGGCGVGGTGTSLGVCGLATNTGTGVGGGYFQNGHGVWAYVAYTSNSNIDYKINGSGTVSTIMETREGRKNLFAPEMPEAYFEDCGEGQLSNGHCRVNLEKLFSDCITVNAEHPLRVFVQLEDDCKGVYVNKDATGFDVYELQGGKSNARFSWRVLAKWKGYEKLRLPEAPGPLPTVRGEKPVPVENKSATATPPQSVPGLK